MEIKIPVCALILIVGADDAQRMDFAKRFFQAEEIFSVENPLFQTSETLEEGLKQIEERLMKGALAAILTQNDSPILRKGLRVLAVKCHAKLIGIALKNEEAASPDTVRFLKNHQNEGFKKIEIIDIQKDTSDIQLERKIPSCNKKEVTGNFDIIGDIHGCFEELAELLEKIGYSIQKKEQNFEISCPENRKLIFVGDLTDRGPNSPDVLRLVMQMVKAKQAYCVSGNHDAKLLRRLSGQSAKLTHGLDKTMEQLEKESPAFWEETRLFLDKLVSHYVFDDGNLVVAHAGIKAEMQGKVSGKIQSFCLYGDTTGKSDEYGLPIRLNWAEHYKGKAMVVYGHTPVREVEWQNNTIDIDTGCVFGGKLTALRYPEKEIVQVAAKEVYCVHAKPF